VANIPVSGFPKDHFMGKPDSTSGRNLKVYGFEALSQALATSEKVVVHHVRIGLTEVGLFMEREIKLGTPVDYGRLRASIGHFEPSGMTAPGNDDDGPPGWEQQHVPQASDAIFAVSAQPKSGKMSVLVGTNVHYAPYIEDGFTVSQRRLVYIPRVGWRYVNPFSYRGAHMFENGLEQAAKAAPFIMEPYVLNIMAALGLGEA
jgi:hypothetical protein